MNILRQLMEKPWEGPGDLALSAGPAPAPRAASVGLKVFLCVVTVLFSLLVVVYSERMLYEDWRPAPRQALLWLNTAVLLLSSAAMEWSLLAARRGRLEEARSGLLAAGLFAVAFLAGQLLAWRQLGALGAFDPGNPAAAFFYLITALHGLHLLGGLVAWARTAAGLWRRPDLARAVVQLRLCATYWHFLLALWLVLFGLLFSGSDNLGTLLAICGLR